MYAFLLIGTYVYIYLFYKVNQYLKNQSKLQKFVMCEYDSLTEGYVLVLAHENHITRKILVLTIQYNVHYLKYLFH